MSDERPTQLDLFSGIGGFALAAQRAGFRTIGFCEIDKYCQKVLAKNFMADASLAAISTGNDKRKECQSCNGTGLRNFNSSSCSRLFTNIFDLDGRQFKGVTLITGGFPCQPFSVAGKRRGAADDRHLWPEMFRVISEARPAWVLGENVPGIIPMELDNVLSDLEGIGYATRSFVIPACAVDARHRRDRVWIVCRRIVSDSCESGSQGSIFRSESGNKTTLVTAGCSEKISYTEEQGLDGKISTWGTRSNGCTPEYDGSDGVRWLTEPDVGFCSDGLPSKLDGGRIDGTTSVSGRSEELLALWEKVAPTAIQRATGGQWRIPSAEVLLAGLHGEGICQKHIGEICETQAGYKIPWELLRIVWGYDESARSSHRSESQQRLAGEHPNFMCLLSHYAPPPCPACWSDNSWEAGLTRVSKGVKNRVDRLKGLGNAIVPQVAYEILKEIRKLI